MKDFELTARRLKSQPLEGKHAESVAFPAAPTSPEELFPEPQIQAVDDFSSPPRSKGWAQLPALGLQVTP